MLEIKVSLLLLQAISNVEGAQQLARYALREPRQIVIANQHKPKSDFVPVKKQNSKHAAYKPAKHSKIKNKQLKQPR